MNQSEEITNMYYEAVGYKNILPGFRKKSIEAVNQLLQNGVDYGKIVKAIEYYVECFDTYSDKPYINMSAIFNIQDVQSILKVNTNEAENLIDKARFYFHRKLRTIPEAPSVVINEDGLQSVKVEPFFLEMKKLFTYDELLEYFYEVHEIDKLSRKEKRDGAAIRYVVEQYKESNLNVNWLDLILYMIDVSRSVIIEEDKRPMINVLHIQNYEQDALDLLENKMNYERINGVDKVVSREYSVDTGNGWTK